VFQNDVFQIGAPELQVRLDDSSVEVVRDVVEQAFSFWKQKLDDLKL
jgi:hypothetical protein